MPIPWCVFDVDWVLLNFFNSFLLILPDSLSPFNLVADVFFLGDFPCSGCGKSFNRHFQGFFLFLKFVFSSSFAPAAEKGFFLFRTSFISIGVAFISLSSLLHKSSPTRPLSTHDTIVSASSWNKAMATSSFEDNLTLALQVGSSVDFSLVSSGNSKGETSVSLPVVNPSSVELIEISAFWFVLFLSESSQQSFIGLRKFEFFSRCSVTLSRSEVE